LASFLQRQHSEPGRAVIDWPTNNPALTHLALSPLRTSTTSTRHSHHFLNTDTDPSTSLRRKNSRPFFADASAPGGEAVYQTSRGSTRIGDFFPAPGGLSLNSWEGGHNSLAAKSCLNRSLSAGSTELGHLRLHRHNSLSTQELSISYANNILRPAGFIH
jgi:hypothetical protein